MKKNEFISETYVTFHQAKALEELGFDGYKWDCDFWYYYDYHNHDKPIFARCEQVDSYDVEQHWYAPTLAHAQKWLRETKDMCVMVMKCTNIVLNIAGKYFSEIREMDGKTIQCSHNIKETYEEALSEGIDEALELLKEE